MSDIFAEQQSLARRQQLLQAMQQQNMQTPITGNTGIGQLLAQLGTTALNQSTQGDLDAQRSANDQKYSAGLGDALSTYLQQRTGSPAQHTLPADQAGPQVPAIAADPRAAIMGAMTSRYPEMQKAGAADLAALGKQEAEKFGTTPQRMMTKSGQEVMGVLSDRGNVKTIDGMTLPAELMAVNNVVINKNGDPSKPLADYGVKGGEVIVDDRGDKYQKMSDGSLKKLDNAPKITNTTNVKVHGAEAGEDEFTKTLGKEQAGVFKASQDKAMAAQQTISTVGQLRALDKQGVFSGPTSGVATSLAQLGKSLGMPIDESKLANTELSNKVLAQEIASFVSQGPAARSMTDSDAKFLKDSLPSLIQSPQGREQIFQRMERGASQSLAHHKSLQTQLTTAHPQAAGMLTADFVGMPGSPTAPTAPTTPVPGMPTGAKVKRYNPATGRLE